MYLSNQGLTALLWLWPSCLWPKDEREEWTIGALIDFITMTSIVFDGRSLRSIQTRKERSGPLPRTKTWRMEEPFQRVIEHTQAMIVSCFDMVHLYFTVFQNPPLSVVLFRRSGTMVILKKMVWSCHSTTVRPMDMHGLRRASWITADSCWLLVIITHMPERKKIWCTARYILFSGY